MSQKLECVRDQARELPDAEKLALVDTLLIELGQPDAELEEVWAREASERRQAHHEGRLHTRDYREVIERLRRP